MHTSTILSLVSCIVPVFGGNPSEPLHLATTGQDAQELFPGQSDGKLHLDSDLDLHVPGQDPDIWVPPHDQAAFDFHALRHNNSFDQQVKCIWANIDQYCIFADSQFDQSKGVAFVTTPERAKRIFEATVSATARNHASTRKPLFRTVDGVEGKGPEGKGRGLFANGYITAGTLLTIESPIILMDEDLYEDLPSQAVQTALLKLAVERLPTATTQTFRELLGWGTDADSLASKLHTNSYQIFGGPTKDWPGMENEPDSRMMAVHANISKINHGCRPNTAAQWNWNLFAHRMYALRDIAPDEELTMAYFDTRQTLEARQKYLTESLEFQCSCSHCKAQNKTLDLSEDRINEILLLESYLENRQVAPAEPTAMAELLVSLYEQEGLRLHISKAYALAAIEYNGVGNEYKARSWAYKSIEASLIVGEGANIDEYVMDMEDLLDGARIHWSWRHRLGGGKD